ncbi:competence type IV pilus minor pilin ComGF [Lederbergia wuyishanensis]|uniref:Competence protein ComGF n=1 Tax=Lederbergia wuyishanensis TaxID=1347903 RepID=A0ABU0D1B7_9BACI|nr:competence type IV pilus minor pilin ComGF [Lederbergia wuyishanensis]MCJ8006818.1 ComGF family competence protein [Lederbergia wuyishanensis]MDQ0342202.1 competence protein ComGF [Lederbergia wuyishanensis]
MLNVKYVTNDQKGFTLLDSIFCMLILSIIMSLMPLLFQSFATIDRTIYVDEDFEWNLFLIHLRKELKDAEKVYVYSHPNRILIEKNFMIIYEPYSSSVRRTVNDRGHEIVLQQVSSVKFSKIDQLLIVNVTFSSGVKEEARFVIPPEKEEVQFVEMKKEPLIQSY